MRGLLLLVTLLLPTLVGWVGNQGGGGGSSGPPTPDSVSTATLRNAAVTLPKLADLAPQTFIGRYSGGSGAPQALSFGAGLDLDGSGVLTVLPAAGSWNVSCTSVTTTVTNSASADQRFAQASFTLPAGVAAGTTLRFTLPGYKWAHTTTSRTIVPKLYLNGALVYTGVGFSGSSTAHTVNPAQAFGFVEVLVGGAGGSALVSVNIVHAVSTSVAITNLQPSRTIAVDWTQDNRFDIYGAWSTSDNDTGIYLTAVVEELFTP